MKVFSALLLVFTLISCNGDNIPKGVLGKEQMTRVLSDVILAESYSESFLLIDTSRTRDEWFTGELNKVLAIHKVSQDQFRNSLNYYKTRPDLFKVIVDTIHAQSSRRQEADQVLDRRKGMSTQ